VAPDSGEQPDVALRRRPWIRIAAFHFGPVDQAKMARQHVMGGIVQIIRDFDIVAVQDIRAENPAPLVQLIELVNAGGRHYDFAVSSDVGRKPLGRYGAFLYDKQTIQIDPATVCRVSDPTGSFRWPPLVAAFRTRGVQPSQAFTFTLISVQVDRSRAAAEVDLLDDVYRAVRDDGRGEDDVILLGYLGADTQHLGQLAALPYSRSVAGPLPTATRGTGTVDHILLDAMATVEFTGRAGVVDIMRRLNLSMPEAVEVSEHLPVWAEFSIFEGGQSGFSTPE